MAEVTEFISLTKDISPAFVALIIAAAAALLLKIYTRHRR